VLNSKGGSSPPKKDVVPGHKKGSSEDPLSHGVRKVGHIPCLQESEVHKYTEERLDGTAKGPNKTGFYGIRDGNTGREKSCMKGTEISPRSSTDGTT